MSQSKVRSIPRARDINKLHGVIRGLLGQECWKAAFSYGGELLLHFGARIPCNHPKLATEREGEWVFGTRGTAWILYTSKGIVRSTDRTDTNEEQLERKLTTSLRGSRVSNLEGGKSLN